MEWNNNFSLEPIKTIIDGNEYLEEWKPIKAEMFEDLQGNIGRIVRGERWKHIL